MSEVIKRVSHPLYNLLPTEIDGFDSLAELALDNSMAAMSKTIEALLIAKMVYHALDLGHQKER